MKTFTSGLLSSLVVTVFTATLHASSFRIDFGSHRPELSTQATGWNNIVSTTESLTLVDSEGRLTGVTLTISSPFHTGGQGNTAGTSTPGGLAMVYPGTATGDSLYGHSEVFRGESKRNPVITFRGLDPARVYSFAYYASRVGPPVRDRTTDYVLNNGSVTDVKSLNAQDNHNQIVISAQLAPSAEGTLTLSLVPGAANSTAEGFTYLGVLEIESVPALRRLVATERN